MIQSTRFEALGCEVRLAVLDGRLDRVEGAARRVLASVDATYSRFRPDSELSRLNARPEEEVLVSPLLATAIDVALRAASETDGLVDPTVGRAMRLIGYDDDFARIRGRTERIVLHLERVPGWKAVRFDAASHCVRLRRGVELDLGSTGKALASELAAEAALTESRARGVLVSIGGDVAMAGEAPGDGWDILIADDSRALPDGRGDLIALHTGGIATSSTSVRRWVRGDVEFHHIIDPRTGLSAVTPWRTVTAVADRCVWANAAATAAIVMGDSALGVAGIARLIRAPHCHRRVRGGHPWLAAGGRSRRVIEAIPWYLTRSAGIVSLVLLSAATCLGLLTSARWQHEGWPRFLTAELHRTISLLAVAFLAVHVVVAVFDPTYGLGIAAALIPFASSYRELWLTLGVVSLYLGVAVVITSLFRSRIGHRTWRLVHLTSYAAWPLAVLHSMGTGTDSVANWLWVIYAACIITVAVSLAWRLYIWRSMQLHVERALPAPPESGWR